MEPVNTKKFARRLRILFFLAIAYIVVVLAASIYISFGLNLNARQNQNARFILFGLSLVFSLLLVLRLRHIIKQIKESTNGENRI